VLIAVAGLALAAGCSGSSSDSGAGPSTTVKPGPHRPRVTFPRTPAGPKVTKPTRPIPPGDSTGLVLRVPASIDDTGRTEVTRQLQSLFAHIPDGTALVFRRNGRYRVERTLYLRNRRGITFEGNGATIFATKRGAFDRTQIWVKRGTDIVFRNLTVRGVNPSGGTSEGAYVRRLETQHGFRFEGTDGAELDHVTVTDVYGDFVYLGRDRRKRPCRNIWIHDSTFLRNGRQGIAVTSARNVVIERNHFSATRRSTIDLEPNAHSWSVSKVFVLNNVVGKGRLLFVASHGQGQVDDIVISGNVLRGHDLTIDALPPEGERRSNWIITNNVSDTTVHHRPLRFFSIDGLVVTNNTQRVAGNQPGVVLTDDCGTHVSGNDFGTGGVRRHGDTCAAPLDIPAEPPIPGRGGPSTTTTTPPPATTTRPHNRPGTTHRPPRGPSSTRPAAPTSGGGESARDWLVLTAVLGVLAALVVAILARRRRGRPPGR